MSIFFHTWIVKCWGFPISSVGSTPRAISVPNFKSPPLLEVPQNSDRAVSQANASIVIQKFISFCETTVRYSDLLFQTVQTLRDNLLNPVLVSAASTGVKITPQFRSTLQLFVAFRDKENMYIVVVVLSLILKFISLFQFTVLPTGRDSKSNYICFVFFN